MGSITAVEWSRRSQRGELCGMFGCSTTKKLRKCCICPHHYCAEHLHIHEGIPHPVKTLSGGGP